MDLGITGRSAVVTGGAGGSGLETARILLEEGCESSSPTSTKRS